MSRRERPDKATVLALLGMAESGRGVDLEHVDVIEDVDGIPAAVDARRVQVDVVTNLAALGWTQEELDDPTITE